MERVIVDMDEVIADPLGEMIRWYEAAYGQPVNMEMICAGSWLSAFQEEHRQLVRQRLFEPGFFRHLPVMANSQEVLKAINERYELYIVSAAMEFPNSLKDKLEWLNEHFPFLSWRQLVLCGDKKLVYGDHMIDDHVRHLKHFNGKKYLYTAPHNVEEDGFIRVNDWLEIAGIFLS
jgi:5'(3')-deoxyribonucleotidase